MNTDQSVQLAERQAGYSKNPKLNIDEENNMQSGKSEHSKKHVALTVTPYWCLKHGMQRIIPNVHLNSAKNMMKTSPCSVILPTATDGIWSELQPISPKSDVKHKAF